MTSIRVESKGRAIEKRTYRVRVKAWLKGKKCVMCGTRVATECHHSHGRRGKLLLYEPFWLAVCQMCHAWVHENPDGARERGMICRPGQWNDQRLCV